MVTFTVLHYLEEKQGLSVETMSRTFSNTGQWSKMDAMDLNLNWTLTYPLLCRRPYKLNKRVRQLGWRMQRIKEQIGEDGRIWWVKGTKRLVSKMLLLLAVVVSKVRQLENTDHFYKINFFFYHAIMNKGLLNWTHIWSRLNNPLNYLFVPWLRALFYTYSLSSLKVLFLVIHFFEPKLWVLHLHLRVYIFTFSHQQDIMTLKGVVSQRSIPKKAFWSLDKESSHSRKPSQFKDFSPNHQIFLRALSYTHNTP